MRALDAVFIDAILGGLLRELGLPETFTLIKLGRVAGSRAAELSTGGIEKEVRRLSNREKGLDFRRGADRFSAHLINLSIAVSGHSQPISHRYTQEHS